MTVNLRNFAHKHTGPNCSCNPRPLEDAKKKVIEAAKMYYATGGDKPLFLAVEELLKVEDCLI